MKFFQTITVALASASLSSAFSVPSDTRDISVRDTPPSFFNAPVESINELFKRKGGGGKGGGGGSGGGGSSSGGSRTGGSSSSGAGAVGGTTGIRPSYSGGRFYGGGATSAYTAGSRSPRGISPVFLASPLLLFPGIWAAGAFAYPYHNHYTFHNSSATNSTNPSGVNQTKAVECLCAKNADCGCDDNDDTSFLNSVVGNGSYQALNKTLVNVAKVNGTDTIVLNGTLPSGTAASATSGAARTVAEWSGYWVMVVTVMYAVWGL